jgi:lipopolysaccharide/colanic/teichoic acid biosynthesis glycosyltransferase
MEKLGQVMASSILRRGERSRKESLCAAEVFQALLCHERARVERDGTEFSLVVFPCEWREPLLDPLRKAMRSIDEVGWLDQRTVGVLLPITSFEGGVAFTRRVAAFLGTQAAEMPLEVFSYPQHWYPQSREERGDGGRRNEPEVGFSSCPELPEVLERVFRKRIPGWKRVLDVSGSLVGLLLLSPLFLLISMYIKGVSPGPVLFRHQRVGLRGKSFTFLKFRTMKIGNNQGFHKEHIVAAIRAGGALEKLDDKGDSRIIVGGRILRKTCLDELPQLINVLRGEMSLVGPRPCMAYEAQEFLRWHTHRFDALPGMTGLWQVSGKNKLTFSQMIRLDISYAESMSFWRDIGILLRTFPAIIVMVAEAVGNKMSEKSRVNAQGAEDFNAAPGV